jgi:hypothetical protein
MARFGKIQAILFALVWAPCFWTGISLYGQARPVVAEDAPAEIHEMQAVEDRWSDAVTKRDQYALELVLSPQFIGISSTGDVSTRDQQISRLLAGVNEPLSLEQKVISVRTVGEITIVNGTYVKHWKLDKGPVDERGIYSHVFLRGRAGWLCLNSQQTVVSESGPETAAKAAAKPKAKSSDASLPFHIPLIYKGPSSTQPSPAPGTNEPPSE